jgi:hypothetical protein
MIDRIRHEATGEERRQREYLRIVERLRRSMRNRLVVETEDWPSTERAAVEHGRLSEPPVRHFAGRDCLVLLRELVQRESSPRAEPGFALREP